MLSALLAVGLLISLGSGGVLLLRSLRLRLSPLELVAYGAPVGLVVGSLLILLLASLVGRLTPIIVVAPVLATLGAVFLLRRTREGPVAVPEVPTPGRPLLLVLGVAAIAWALFWSQALRMTPDGISAGTVGISGDWSLHLGDVSSFAYGDNFPPQNPRFAGRGYPYHYLTSITVAAMVRLGMTRSMRCRSTASSCACSSRPGLPPSLCGSLVIPRSRRSRWCSSCSAEGSPGGGDSTRHCGPTTSPGPWRGSGGLAQGARGYEWQNVHSRY